MANLVSPNVSKTIIRPECRVCLKQDGHLPIFGDETKPDISMEISLFGAVQLQENDGLPKFICENCFKLLEGAILFRKLAKRSDALFKRRKKKEEQEQAQSSSSAVMENMEYEVRVLVPVNSESLENSHEFYLNQGENNINFVSVDVEETPFDDELYSQNEEVLDNTLHNNLESGNYTSPEKTSDETATNLYNCKYCSLGFNSSDDYEQHRTTVQHKRNYVMSFLPKKRTKCLDHAKKTASPRDHFCEFCNRVFTKVHYPRHMLSKHKIILNTSRSQAKKECTMCNKMFHPAALANHMKRIHGSESQMKPKVKLECPICKKLFSKHFYPLHLQRHKQGDSKNYICDQCGKKFFFKSSFFTHRLIHTNALPHKCEFCPYRGRTKELLKIHVRTHTGDYPYKCTQCETRCSTKSNLNSHMRRRHRGPIDYVCETCSRGFYSKVQLDRHISVAHYGVKNHSCPVCGAAFGYRHGLVSHLRKVHKIPKGQGKPKAVYLQLEEEGLLTPAPELQQDMPII